DPLLGKHTLAVEAIYQQFGGRVSVLIKDGAGHHPHSLRDPKLIADFIERNAPPSKPIVPRFFGDSAVRTAFYGIENSYREFPAEKTYATCRGPAFGGCYDRYEFK